MNQTAVIVRIDEQALYNMKDSNNNSIRRKKKKIQEYKNNYPLKHQHMLLMLQQNMNMDGLHFVLPQHEGVIKQKYVLIHHVYTNQLYFIGVVHSPPVM